MKKLFLIFLVCAAFQYPQQDNGNASSGLLYIYNQKPAGSGSVAAVPYTYYRFVITVWNDATWSGVGEIALYDNVANLGNVGTANGQLSVHPTTGTASSDQPGLAGSEITDAFNGAVPAASGDCYIENVPHPTYIQFLFGTKPTNAVVAYSIWCSNTATRYPNSWTLQGSDNGTDWTILDTRSGETSSAAYQLHNFTIGE